MARRGSRILWRPPRVFTASAFGLTAGLAASLLAGPSTSPAAYAAVSDQRSGGAAGTARISPGAPGKPGTPGVAAARAMPPANPSYPSLRVHLPMTSEDTSTAAAPFVGVIGDSTGAQLVDPLAAQMTWRGVGVVGATVGRCPASDTAFGYESRGYFRRRGCSRDVRALQGELVDRFRPRVVLWADSPSPQDIKVGEHTVPVGTGRWRRLMMRSWDGTARRLDGAQVVLVLPTWWVGHPRDTPATFPVDEQRALYREWAKRHPDTVTVVDLAPVLCPKGPPCRTSVGGVEVATDRLQLTPAGRRLAVGKIMRDAAVLRDLWGVGVGPDPED